jgi:hypothetical protein
LRFGPLYVAYAVTNLTFDDQRKTAAGQRIAHYLKNPAPWREKYEVVLPVKDRIWVSPLWQDIEIYICFEKSSL